MVIKFDIVCLKHLHKRMSLEVPSFWEGCAFANAHLRHHRLMPCEAAKSRLPQLQTGR